MFNWCRILDQWEQFLFRSLLYESNPDQLKTNYIATAFLFSDIAGQRSFIQLPHGLPSSGQTDLQRIGKTGGGGGWYF